jgi:hypothetical protein
MSSTRTVAAPATIARGIVRFLKLTDGQKLSCVNQVEVEVIGETAECYRVVYPRKFKKANMALCNTDLIRKDDATRTLTYTEFPHTTDEVNSDKAAYYGIVIYDEDGDETVRQTTVEVVETCGHHHRLRFPAGFAAEYPEACREWVHAESENPLVEIQAD